MITSINTIFENVVYPDEPTFSEVDIEYKPVSPMQEISFPVNLVFSGKLPVAVYPEDE
jgi:hypothetical protein